MALPSLEDLQKILEEVTGQHPGLASYFQTLACSYRASYRETDNLDNVNASVECFRAAVRHSPQSHPDFSDHIQNLGVSLSDRYRRLGDLQDLHAAVTLDKTALALTPSGHPDEPERAENLGASLADRYLRLGDINDLEAALQAEELALECTPEGDIHMPKRLNRVAQQYTQRFQQFGNLQDLEVAISYYQTAVDLAPLDYPDRAGLFRGLSMGLTDRYNRFNNLEDLHAAVENDQIAVDLTAEGHHKLGDRLHCLAVSLLDRYHRLGDPEDIEKSLESAERAFLLLLPEDSDEAMRRGILGEIYRARYLHSSNTDDLAANLEHTGKAAELLPPDHPDLPRYLSNLGISLRVRHARHGDLQDLNKAVDFGTNAVASTPAGNPAFPKYAKSLAVTLKERYTHLGDIHDLEEAQKMAVAAMDHLPVGHPDLLDLQVILSVVHSEQYRRSGDTALLQDALNTKLHALSLTPKNAPGLPERLKNVAVSYLDRYIALGDLDDLEASVSKAQEAVSVAQEQGTVYADDVQQLAISLSTRYRRFGNLQDLEEAISNEEKVVAMVSEDDSRLPGFLNNLTTTLMTRFKRLGNMQDLEDALHHNSKAIDLAQTGDPRLAHYNHVHALCHLEKYWKFGSEQMLNDGMQYFQLAVELTPPDNPKLAELYRNYSAALRDRFLKTGRISDVYEALDKIDAAAKLTPEQHLDRPGILCNLARVRMTIYHMQRIALSKLDEHQLNSAIEHDCEAVKLSPPGDPERPQFLQSLANHLSDRYKALQRQEDIEEALVNYRSSFKTFTSSPIDSWKSGLEWAELARIHAPPEALEAYRATFNLLPEILWLGSPLKVRQEHMTQIEIAKASGSAVRACITQSELTLAIELLEQGLATIFQQMLQLKTDFDTLPAGDAQRLRQFSSLLYEGKSTNPLAIAADRNSLLLEIRKRPGFESFLLSKPYAELCMASTNGPIVILTSHAQSCDAIIMLNPTSDPVHVSLPDATVKQLEHHRSALQQVLVRCNSRTRQSESSRLFGALEWTLKAPVKECFQNLLDFLRNNVVQPIYDVLQSHGIVEGRLWWCPTGSFTALPLHAATPHDRFIPSYTSTLGSILHANEKPTETPAQLALVGVTHSQSGPGSHLTSVEREVKTILSISANHPVPTKSLLGAQATVSALESQLMVSSWVHLACHGKQELSDPQKSCLQLYDGTLELESILKMPLHNSEFVFLAACQTAMGDSKLVNESFHLGGGLIAAGFRAAIGTMWSIRDEDGPRVAEIVYKHLFRAGRAPRVTDTAEALHLAVRKMREDGLPYERWVPFIHMGI
ncbi:CHAT domain-containing protein [Roridomyces roridus]|uniref:CHAT domain-containing protein n=1 Tax=Roridomyces roridus TaxID=1738132 RepID=A0AAD7C168_9AGAR|nr:CHAT domain-containing protein [Roridomyces roridus]